jgi:hypothetical protein
LIPTSPQRQAIMSKCRKIDKSKSQKTSTAIKNPARNTNLENQRSLKRGTTVLTNRNRSSLSPKSKSSKTTLITPTKAKTCSMTITSSKHHSIFPFQTSNSVGSTFQLKSNKNRKIYRQIFCQNLNPILRITCMVDCARLISGKSQFRFQEFPTPIAK